MVNNIYVVFDVVSDSTVVIGTAVNDKSFIRQNLPYLAKINPNYREDYKVYCVGTYVDTTRKLEQIEERVIDFDCYQSDNKA